MKLLSQFLFMSILAQAFFSLVRSHFMAFTLLATWHGITSYSNAGLVIRF
jgi:hypothetical protein